METCVECGYLYDYATYGDAAQRITAGADEVALLLNAGGTLDKRPEPTVWSPLEYSCHLRDVLIVQRERVLGALRTPGYRCPPMGREERVGPDGYADQHPADVARQLTDAAMLLSNVLDRLDEKQWEQTLHYNSPVPGERSLTWVAVHTVHEVVHHVMDIRRQV